MHQYDSLISGFLPLKMTCTLRLRTLSWSGDAICQFPKQGSGILKAPLPAHSLNRWWLSHRAPEKDMEQKKMEDPQGTEKCKGLVQVKENV